MSEDRKPIINLPRLLRIFAWSFVRSFLKAFAISWYAYYALQAFTPGEFPVYLSLAMWALSVFGLWQAIEMLQRWATPFAARMERQDRPSSRD